ncbi:zinc finger protein 236-like isoform X2 [Sitodiplosis mosellana]|uniref:zinc finger protein 236-like isoform X2 n=1 Tax=Sitodiplosis mosellana TaxID=263140 RepID=UPI002443C7B2|nr:zinc finger protein 236-like isoform X2 [Sitodiplosis mosellana]
MANMANSGSPLVPESANSLSPLVPESATSANISHIRRSLRLVSDVQLACGYCPQKFLLQCNLKFHEALHQIKQRLRESTPICKLCKKKFSNNQRLKNHRCTSKENQKPFECSVCHKKFTNKRLRDVHEENHLDLWNCTQCPETFECEGDFLDHEQIHLWIESVEPHLDCSESELIFKTTTSCTYVPVLNLRNLLGELEEEMEARSSDESDDGQCDDWSNNSELTMSEEANIMTMLENDAQTNDSDNESVANDEANESGNEVSHLYDDATSKHSDANQIEEDFEGIDALNMSLYPIEEEVTTISSIDDLVAETQHEEPIYDRINDLVDEAHHDDPIQDQIVAVVNNPSPMEAVSTLPVEIVPNDEAIENRCDLTSHKNNESLEHEHHIHQNATVVVKSIGSDVMSNVSLATQQINEVGSESQSKRYSLRLNRTIASSRDYIYLTTAPIRSDLGLGADVNKSRRGKCSLCDMTFHANRKKLEHKCLVLQPKVVLKRIGNDATAPGQKVNENGSSHDVSKQIHTPDQVVTKSKSPQMNRQCNETELNVPEVGLVLDNVLETISPLNDVNEDIQSQNDVGSNEIECATVQENDTVQNAPVPEEATVITEATEATKPTTITSKPCSLLSTWNIQPKFDCFKCKQRFDSKQSLELHRKVHSTENVNIEAHPIDGAQYKQPTGAIESNSSGEELSQEWAVEFKNWASRRKSDRMTKTTNSSEVSNKRHVDQNKRTKLSPPIEVEASDDTITTIDLMSVEPECHGNEVVISTNNFEQLTNDRELAEVDAVEPEIVSESATVKKSPKRAIGPRRSKRDFRRSYIKCDECDADCPTLKQYVKHNSLEHGNQRPLESCFYTERLKLARQKVSNEHLSHIQTKKVAAKESSKKQSESSIPKLKLVRTANKNEWSVTNKV